MTFFVGTTLIQNVYGTAEPPSPSSAVTVTSVSAASGTTNVKVPFAVEFAVLPTIGQPLVSVICVWPPSSKMPVQPTVKLPFVRSLAMSFTVHCSVTLSPAVHVFVTPKLMPAFADESFRSYGAMFCTANSTVSLGEYQSLHAMS